MTSDDVSTLIDEYMKLFGLPGEGPVVEIKDNLGSPWLGRTIYKGGRIWIEIQTRAMEDPDTFEKVLAHEMVHYADMATLEPSDVVLMKLGAKTPEHGRKFWKLADVVNQAKGTDFVTEKSDQSYKLVENAKTFFAVVEEVPGGRFGWRWAAKRTPAIDAIVDRLLAKGAVVFETMDDRLLSGARMRKGAIGCSVAQRGSELEGDLEAIWRGHANNTQG